LYPSGANNVYVQLVGSAPNRVLVVQWQNVPYYGGGGAITAQAQLHENNNQILLLYATPGPQAGNSATVGIQSDPAVGLQYNCNASSLTSQLAILFTRGESCQNLFDVYLGADPQALRLIAQNLVTPSCNAGILDPLSTYYWQVIAHDCCGDTPGTLWDFTTADCIPPAEPSQPSPPDGETGVPVAIPYVSWVGSEGNCATTYDIYAGYDPALLELVAAGLTQTTCPVPGPLPYNTQCYWQVIAINCCGQVPGTVWTFRTENGPTPIYTWDFENGLGGFTFDNTFGHGNGLWHLSTTCLSDEGDHTAPTSLYYGLDSSCNFNAGLTEGVVTSPQIDLAYVTPPIALAFKYFLDTEGMPSVYDKASVELSVDGGPFQIIAHNDYNMGVYVLNDPTFGWEMLNIDLSAYAASTIQVRFHFNTGDSIANAYPGFYVDDVQILGLAPDVQIVHQPLTDTTSPGPYPVCADIVAAFTLARAELFWSIDGGASFSTVPMVNAGGVSYCAEIPGQPVGTDICYYLEAEDVNGFVAHHPDGAPSSLNCFVREGIPNLVVDPESLAFTMPPDSQETKILTLSNTGDWPVEWSLQEGPGGVSSVTATVTHRAMSYTPANRRPVDVDWTKPHDPNTLLVGFKPGTDSSARASAHAAAGTSVAHAYQFIPVEVVRIPNGAQLEQVAAAYANMPNVAFAEPNYRVHAIAIPNDPMFDQLWGLNNTGQTGGSPDADIDAPEAWDISTGSTNVIVGVIDTGCDYNHQDLASQMWTNEPELNGIPGVDDDANGIVDDIHGAKWINGDGSPSSGDPMDDYGHGTHTSGTIGAAGNNGAGVAGVNWNVRIMALKFLDSGGGGWTADAIAAVEYAVLKGANLTSNSWGGGGYDQSLKDAIDAAGAAGQLFIAAAGNGYTNTDGYPNYPSCYESPNIISVAASDHNDLKADFSNYGVVTVDLAAPGVDVLSTVPGNGYAAFDGTSMATPHVAGVAALLLSIAPGTDPLTLKEWILDSVDVLPQWSGVVLTGGRLNAANAVMIAGTPWLTEDPTSGVLGPDESIQIEVTANSAGLTDGYSDACTLSISGDPDGALEVPVTLVVFDVIGIVHTPLEDTTLPGPYSVCADIMSDAGLVRTDLYSSIDGANFTTAPMANTGGTTYCAEIPAQPIGTTFTYYIEAEDVNGFVRTEPRHEPWLSFQYRGVPNLVVSPTSLDFYLPPEQTQTQIMTILNDGTWPVDWSLSQTGVLGPVEIVLPATSGRSPVGRGWVPQDSPAMPKPQTRTAVATYTGAAGVLNVLLLVTDDISMIQQVLVGLGAFPDIGSVDYFDARVATPTLDQLNAYDCVVVASQYYFGDPNAVGNVLADYVDAGGKVVEMLASFATGDAWELLGRFSAEGYGAFTHGGPSFIDRSLGAFDTAHPIMAGVTQLTELFGAAISIMPGAAWVASWNDGLPLVAAKPGVVGINSFPFDYGSWTGDLVLLIHNSIVWLGGDWLSYAPQSGPLQPGESVEISVTADATGLEDGFQECKIISVQGDSDGPIDVPVCLSVGSCTIPVANFDADTTAGCAPLPVQFSDLSTGGPTSWLWEFGDGETSSEQNPGHTFTSSGIYSVCLTVSNGCGSDVFCADIAVSGDPDAEFSGSPLYGNAPVNVQFSDLSTGAPAAWAWDFGDGETSTEQNPLHEYDTPGVYTVTLTVANPCSENTEAKTGYINVTQPDMRANRAFWYFKYSPQCQTQDVQITLDNDGADDLTALGLIETIPEGWAFDSLVSPPACAPAVVPPQGATGALEFAWLCIPAFPYTFTYRLTMPPDAAGDQFFGGLLLYRRSGPELLAPVGLLDSIVARVSHSIDYNTANQIVSLSELLRAIQFYNSGSYHYEPGTEDGYGPGVGSHDGPPHDADYNSQNWAIGLSELLRLIQFYNSGGYHVECGTEDGYAPGLLASGAEAAKALDAPQAPARLTAARTIAAADKTRGALDLTVDINCDGAEQVTALSLVEVLPEGWTFDSVVGGDIPALSPRAGSSGTLEFAWVWIPDLPATLTYRVNAPPGADPGQIAGQILYRTSGEELQANVEGSPAGLFYVDAATQTPGDGSETRPFITVAAAVKTVVAGRGDTILVRPGVYLESVALKAGTTLAGEGAPASILVTGAQGAGVAVTMAGTSALRGLSIGTLKVPVAIRVTSDATVEIADCIIAAGQKAIETAESSTVNSTNNQITEGTPSPLDRHN
ncbi:MAG: S8 family serine peptidase, partial [Candidatus Hydrogenedentes bacterium]|nr:S8 family serine peptidase [Candidatus Hydrogenedentota bacterium]